MTLKIRYVIIFYFPIKIYICNSVIVSELEQTCVCVESYKSSGCKKKSKKVDRKKKRK